MTVARPPVQARVARVTAPVHPPLQAARVARQLPGLPLARAVPVRVTAAALPVELVPEMLAWAIWALPDARIAPIARRRRRRTQRPVHSAAWQRAARIPACAA